MSSVYLSGGPTVPPPTGSGLEGNSSIRTRETSDRIGTYVGLECEVRKDLSLSFGRWVGTDTGKDLLSTVPRTDCWVSLS